MSWCDPCAANPLSTEELRKLGVFWLGNSARPFRGGGQEAFLTRLHVRYDAEHFPEDLIFQETADRSNFQARYVLRHAWKGAEECPAAKQYREALRERHEREAQTLANLTGWSITDIRRKMQVAGDWLPVREKQWYEKLWSD
jgi:hypothetical protein